MPSACEDTVPALDLSWHYCIDTRITIALVTDFYGHGYEHEGTLDDRGVDRHDDDAGPQLRLVSLVRSSTRPPDAVLVQIAAAGVQSFSHPAD